MPQFQSNYFGNLEYSEQARIHFSFGVPGFETEREFVLIEQERLRPLAFLQSLTTPGLCFLTIPVLVVERSYRLQLSPEDLETLGFAEDAQPVLGRDVLCLALLSVTPDGPPTANLWSPVVINLKNLRATQVIQSESSYSISAGLPEAAREVLC